MTEVLINHMYSGNYLETGNLGHEVINLFKCDNGNHYIYAMSAGDYDTKTHNNAIKKVILVRNVDQHKAEILGICDVEEEIFASEIDEPNKYTMFPSVNELINKDFMNKNNLDGTPKDNKTLYRIETYKKIHERQIDYIDKYSITYGNVKLYDLFLNNNTTHSDHAIYLTFKVVNFRRPKELIYLCDNRCDADNTDTRYFRLTERERMCGASVATYENLEDSEIQRLINAPYWEDKDNSPKVDINNINIKSTSLLNIIKKNNDEITYSNWISYYLKNDKELLKRFITHFTNEDGKTKSSFEDIEIIRESKNNIDIYYEDSQSIYVFENKIKSSINGTQKKDDSTEEEKEFSQLEKYYIFAEKEAEKSTSKKTTGYFLLLPNYAYKDTSKLNKYAKFDKYKIIRYSQLLDFFKSYNSTLPYYEDFLKALEYHASEYLNDLYSEMLERLQSVISLKK